LAKPILVSGSNLETKDLGFESALRFSTPTSTSQLLNMPTLEKYKKGKISSFDEGRARGGRK
jgi:hypothetical protein